MSKTDWDSFKDDLSNHHSINLQGKTTEDIDSEMDRLHSAIKTSITKHTPTSHFRTLPNNRLPEEVKLIQTYYNEINRYMERHGSNRWLLLRVGDLEYSYTSTQIPTGNNNKKQRQSDYKRVDKGCEFSLYIIEYHKSLNKIFSL